MKTDNYQTIRLTLAACLAAWLGLCPAYAAEGDENNQAPAAEQGAAAPDLGEGESLQEAVDAAGGAEGALPEIGGETVNLTPGTAGAPRATEIDNTRASLRQSLLEDRAREKQKEAIDRNSSRYLSPEIRAARQRIFEEEVRRRGEERLKRGDVDTGTGKVNANRPKERVTFDRENQTKPLENERQTDMANAIKRWATGQADSEEERKRVRQETLRIQKEQKEQKDR